ncbi:MAG: ABC transporter permease subunit [Bacteroidota bacterium]
MPKPKPSRAWRRFRSSRSALFALGVVVIWILMALIGPYLANPLPYRCEYRGQTVYPIFQPERLDSLIDPYRIRTFEEMRWDTMAVQNVLWALIPYGSREYPSHKSLSPFASPQITIKGVLLEGRFRHHLGTNREGRDILAILILGSRDALLFALIAVGLIALIGLLIGSISGYLGDQSWAQSRGVVLGFWSSLIPAWFYGFYVRRYEITLAEGPAVIGQFLISALIFVLVIVLFVQFGRWLSRWAWWRKPLWIPLDLLFLKLIELRESLPVIMLVIALGSIFGRNVWFFIICVGLIGWTGIARLVRAEMLRIRQTDYIQAAQSLGLSPWQIIRRHALPNALPPVLVVLILSLGNAVLLEASLCFSATAAAFLARIF